MGVRTTVGVTAVGGGVGQAVLRSLKMSRLDLRIVGFDPDPWGAGVYFCDKAHRVPFASDSAYPEAIKSLCAREDVKVLFPGSDPELTRLSAIRDDLEALGCLAVVGSQESVRVCRDKRASFEFFAPRGVPFAKTRDCARLDELVSEVGFPVIVKPVDGSSSQGATVLFSEGECAAFRGRDGFIAQEYLVPASWGKRRNEVERADALDRQQVVIQRDEVSSQVFLSKAGKPLGFFASVNSLKHGVPMTVRPIRDACVEAEALRAAAALANIGLVGPCNFQGKVTDRGLAFFEVNPRFTGITAVRSAMRYNECAAAVRHFGLGQDDEAVMAELAWVDGFVASRYVTEVLIPSGQFDELATRGEVSGKGLSVSL